MAIRFVFCSVLCNLVFLGVGFFFDDTLAHNRGHFRILFRAFRFSSYVLFLRCRWLSMFRRKQGFNFLAIPVTHGYLLVSIMKIILLTPLKGGAEVVVADLARELASGGHTVKVFCFIRGRTTHITLGCLVAVLS